MGEISSFRSKDESGEKEVAKFLDEKFYKATDFERIFTKDLQIKGVDTMFSIGSEKIYCDEKVALNYINRYLNTYSFELMFINRAHKEQVGWFNDSSKITTHYLLCYITKCKVDRYPRKEDIEEMEVILISRKALYKYLVDKGLDYNTITSKVENINKGIDIDMGNIKDGYKFSKSPKFVESPVNILIPKDILIDLSTVHRILR